MTAAVVVVDDRLPGGAATLIGIDTDNTTARAFALFGRQAVDTGEVLRRGPLYAAPDLALLSLVSAGHDTDADALSAAARVEFTDGRSAYFAETVKTHG